MSFIKREPQTGDKVIHFAPNNANVYVQNVSPANKANSLWIDTSK